MCVICDITTLDQDISQWQDRLIGKEYNQVQEQNHKQDFQVILEIFPHVECIVENPAQLEDLDVGSQWSLDFFLRLKEPLRFTGTKEDIMLEKQQMEDLKDAGIQYRLVYTGNKVREFIQKYGIQRYSDAKAQQACVDILYTAGYVIPMGVVHQLSQQYRQVLDDAKLIGLV